MVRVVCAMLLAAGLLAAQPTRGGPPQNFDNVELHLFPVQGNVYMMVGAGGNITVQIGGDGVLLVDTMFAPLAPRIAAEIKKISPLPIRYIIDTHVDDDHTGGCGADSCRHPGTAERRIFHADQGSVL